MSVLSDLLHDLVDYLERYVVFTSDAHARTIALFVAATYVAEQFDTCPYLHVTSPAPQSGKTTLLDALRLTVHGAWQAVTPSEAVVFRMLDARRAVLLLDEIDAIYGPKAREHEGLRAILNAGHRRGSKVPRCNDKGDLLEFDVSGPKVLCGIGRIPDTVADRSIPIPLKRKPPGARVDRFRVRNVEPQAINLSERLTAWADRTDLGDAAPPLPETLSDRQQDTWEPLLAIADEAGRDWPRLAREAGVAIHAREEGDENLPIQLLADCRDVFGEREKLFTEDLLAGLHAKEGSPWPEYGRDRKPITANALARLLRPFEVRPSGTIRIGDETKKGYERTAFEDAWLRYLPRASQEAPETSQRHNAAGDCDGVTEAPPSEEGAWVF